jgi:PKD repeat protein
MIKGLPARLSLCAAMALASACTVHQTEAPALAGPSEFALSFTVAATPDSITQDGVSQSSIVVTARDASGAPVAGLQLGLAIVVSNTQAAFGTLSARTVFTGADGRATSTYTSPTASPYLAGGPPTIVSVVATPVGNDYRKAISQRADIKVTPPPLLTPVPGGPTATVTFSPSSPKVGQLVTFDATSSQPAPGHQITTYFWDFGDGLPQSEEGNDASHVYEVPGTYTMVLGVVDDVGRIGSIFKTIVVSP